MRPQAADASVRRRSPRAVAARTLSASKPRRSRKSAALRRTVEVGESGRRSAGATRSRAISAQSPSQAVHGRRRWPRGRGRAWPARRGCAPARSRRAARCGPGFRRSARRPASPRAVRRSTAPVDLVGSTPRDGELAGQLLARMLAPDQQARARAAPGSARAPCAAAGLSVGVDRPSCPTPTRHPASRRSDQSSRLRRRLVADDASAGTNFSRSSASSWAAIVGLSLRYWRAFSLPWPMRSPP